MYGSNANHERHLLWKNLAASNPSPSTPWLVGGDFNEVRYSTEKQGGRSPNLRRLHKFNACLDNCNLHDLEQFGVVQKSLSEDQAALQSLQATLILEPLNQGLVEEERGQRRKKSNKTLRKVVLPNGEKVLDERQEGIVPTSPPDHFIQETK
ncbi:hypothetical protein QJS10_CPA06g01028 [Acorus calamus]|uniref:Uncharacterized protein n=1 Tax=Acorus calamus TaxID=4465 RepID=A0AAV9EJW1_ACOCL|nr:hypothetical protein QJS10_CPA06g01028 [Acorus calamus]